MRRARLRVAGRRELCQQLKASGWHGFQRASRKWRGRRKLFQDKEAGGWADGGGRLYTLRTAATTAWRSERRPAARRQLCQDKAAGEGQHGRHPGAEANIRQGGRDPICLFQSISQQLRDGPGSKALFPPFPPTPAPPPPGEPWQHRHWSNF